ncbi:MAG: class I SAM-dependent methyltransferase [Alphaproteobacteria bacterium]
MAKAASEPAEWDRDYRAGRWSYLTAPKEQARLAVAALYVRLFGGGRVLDIGCGSGQLFQHLDLQHLVSYTGVDFSKVAIEAAALADARVHFTVASAEAYAPPAHTRYDAILFNEVIYFLDDPLGQIGRYAGYLAPHGVLVVSITRARPEGGSFDRKIDALWSALDAPSWQSLDEVFVSHGTSGNAWRIRALRPSSAAPTAPAAARS